MLRLASAADMRLGCSIEALEEAWTIRDIEAGEKIALKLRQLVYAFLFE